MAEVHVVQLLQKQLLVLSTGQKLEKGFRRGFHENYHILKP